jgi:hypothetical protein
VRVERVRGRSALTRCFARYPLKLIAPSKVGPSSCDAVWLYALTYGGGIVSVSPEDLPPLSVLSILARRAVAGYSRFGGGCGSVTGSWYRARARPCRGTPYRARSASATGARRRSPRRPRPRYAGCLTKLDSALPAYTYTMAVLCGLVMLTRVCRMVLYRTLTRRCLDSKILAL